MAGNDTTLYKPRSNEERIAILEEIYDNTLDWIQGSSKSKDGKGTAAAALILERSRLELKELRRGNSPDDKELVIRFEYGQPEADKDG